MIPKYIKDIRILDFGPHMAIYEVATLYIYIIYTLASICKITATGICVKTIDLMCVSRCLCSRIICWSSVVLATLRS